MFTSLFLRSLNREAASRKNRPEEILHHLEIREGRAIADLGSGGGFFTLSFAGRTGKNGKVYAVDTQPKYLDFIRRRSEREGLSNIVLVQGMEMDKAGFRLLSSADFLPDQTFNVFGPKPPR